MGVAHVGLVLCDSYRYKVKGFRVVSSIERNVSKRHLQGVRHYYSRITICLTILNIVELKMI